jgi:hypothetical protein
MNKRIKNFLRNTGLICLLFAPVMAGAQIHNIILTVPKPNPLPAPVLADYNFNIGQNVVLGTAGVHVATAAATVQWNFTSLPGGAVLGADNFVFQGITVKLPAIEGANISSALNIDITGTPIAGATSFSFSVQVNDASDITNVAVGTFTLLIHQPVDIVMVLDRSGSMGWGYDGSDPPPDGVRRWDGLLAGVGVFQAQLQGAGILKTGDMLGMRMFASSPNVINPAAPFNAGLVAGPANVASLSTVLAGVVPNNGTALGDGIIAGRDLLWPGTVNNKKAMIVFSDGVQNRGNQVNVVAPNQYTHAGAQKLSSPGNEIKIHTICLGSTGHNPMLMQGIATANGGQYLNTTTGAESDFVTFFTTHLTTILSGSSPQVVDIKKGVFPASAGGPPPTTEKSFSVNRGARAVVITLIAPTRNEAQFTSVQKDGIELIQFAQRTSGVGYISIAVRYPMTGLPVTTLNGEWKVKAQLGTSPGSAVPYSMMAVADDHVLRPSFLLGAGSFKVNAAFNPKVSLQADGRAVKNATVQVVVVKPGDDINDLVAAAKVQFTVPPGDPGTPDVAKLAALMNDTAFLNKIKAKDQVLNMTYNASDSMYAGSFNGLDIAGVYQAIYRVTADDPILGKIERYHQESFYVRFPDIEVANSQMVFSTNAAGFSVITFRPQASNKKLIGLGWGPAIFFEADNLKATNVVDKGDGSYEITLNGKLSGSFTLSLGGETVFKGKPGELSCYGANANFIQRIKCWLMSKGLPDWSIWVILFLLVLILWALIKRIRR